MTIQQRITQQLERLATHEPEQLAAVVQKAPKTGYLLGVPPEGGKGVGASLNLADYDRYSAALRHLEIYDNSQTVASGQEDIYLQQVAATIAQKLTFLEEPLELLELDGVEHTAQLRSNPPRRSADESIYWEIQVWVAPHPHARITRYRWLAGEPDRIAITYPATFATLGRIAENLAGALSVEPANV